MAQKEILIITYYWPPAAGGGVQRWMYFALHLSKMGFKPIVITVKPQKASYPLTDNSLNDLVKNVETIYTDTAEPHKLYSFLKTGNSKKDIPYGNLGQKSGSLFSKFAAFIRANFFIPDARKAWTKFVMKAGNNIINKRKIQWIITTGPPHSTHLAGYKLSKKHNIKWLADFRDPWTDIYFLQETFRFNFIKNIDNNLESVILNNADIVTTVGPAMAELLKKKMLEYAKLKVLYNGFDDELLKTINLKTVKNQKFIISHLGLLGSSQRFDVFIGALIESGIELSQTEIIIAGNVHQPFLEKLQNLPEKPELKHFDFLPRKEALSIMKNSDLLLLCPPMLGNTELIVSTKTMEYLACKVPVLGIGDTNSDAAKLVKNQSISAFFKPDEIKQISEFIKLKFNNYKNNIKEENDIDVSKYSRFEVSRKLAEILNNED